MAERPTANWKGMSTASKILLVAGGLFFIDLFFPWYSCKVPSGIGSIGCGTANGWHGFLGVLCGILVILILIMEVVMLMNVDVSVGTPQMRLQVEGIGAIVLLVLTILHFLIKPNGAGIVSVGWSWGSFLGLILAIVIAYGGWMRWQESKTAGTAPPPAGGGFAA